MQSRLKVGSGDWAGLPLANTLTPHILQLSSPDICTSPSCQAPFQRRVMNRATGSPSRSQIPNFLAPLPHVHGGAGIALSRWPPSCAFQVQQMAIS
jgi:hypothetical protein